MQTEEEKAKEINARIDKWGKESGEALDKYLAWLNSVQELGNMLVAGAYLRKAQEEYEKLPQPTKDKVEFRSFLVGYVIARWCIDFPSAKM